MQKPFRASGVQKSAVFFRLRALSRFCLSRAVDIVAAFNFIDRLLPEPQLAPLVIQCEMGLSRSTPVALCQRCGGFGNPTSRGCNHGSRRNKIPPALAEPNASPRILFDPFRVEDLCRAILRVPPGAVHVVPLRGMPDGFPGSPEAAKTGLTRRLPQQAVGPLL